MTPAETRWHLRTIGIFVEDFDSKMIDGFCKVMEPDALTRPEMLLAFRFFKRGWEAK